MQTLLSDRGFELLDGRTFDFVIADECHHYRADHWQRAVEQFGRSAKLLGLTAYPQRRDGRALGDIFDRIVSAADYSELIRAGHLVESRVWAPEEVLGHDLAQDPLDEWFRHSEGAQTFVFVPRIEAARDLAARFLRAGVMAEVVASGDHKRARKDVVSRFRQGKTTVLVSVDALTEGIDVPEARCVMLARAFRFLGAYVQAVGRVLRASPGKRDAIVLDLVGAWARHGLPHQDREYSLDGRETLEGETTGKGDGAGGGHGGPAEIEQTVMDRPMKLICRGTLPDAGASVPVPRPTEAIDLARVVGSVQAPADP